MKKNVIGERGELIQKVATFVFVRLTEALSGVRAFSALSPQPGGRVSSWPALKDARVPTFIQRQ